MRSTMLKRTIFILVFSLLILFGGELRSEAYSLEQGLREIEDWIAGPNGVRAILYEKEYGDRTLTLVIQGQGKMDDGSLKVDKNYVSRIKRVQIESGITYIGKNAFKNLTCLESVNIRGDEVRIGEGAFQGLYSLKRVFREKQDDEYCIRFVRGQSVDDRWYKGINVNEIGEGAFANCVNLKKISIGQTCKKIGIKAFEGCNNLNEVQLDPDSQLEEIGNSAFKGCQSLDTFLFNLNLKKIGASAFASTSLVNIIIQNKDTIIGNEAFAGCNAMIYGYKGSTAEQYAKDNNMRFSHETFGTEEEETKEWDISEKQDGSLLAKICENGGHMWLKIELAKEAEGPVRMKSYIPDKYQSNVAPWLYSIYNERIERIEMNDGILSNIGDYAFNGLNNVKEITIPYPVEKIGKGNFYDCNALKKINFPPSLRKLDSTGIEFTGEVTVKGFAGTPFESVGGSEKVKIEYYDENYTWNLGNQGENDNSVIGTLDYVSGKLTISGKGKMKDFQDENHTFWTEQMHMWQNSYGAWIKEVEIKDDVIYLGNYAFSGLRKITVVMIPKDLGMFGRNIFQGCDKLEQVIFLHTGTQYQLELTEGTFNEMNTNTKIYCIEGTKADEFFENNNRDHEHLDGCYNISESDGKSSVIAYLIPLESNKILYVTGKGHIKSYSNALQWNYLFNDGDYPPWLTNPINLGSIKRIIIENGVESIGANVFRCLTYVGKIEIPDSVRKIGNRAFSGRTTGAPGDSIELELVLPSQGISEMGSEIFGPSSAYPVSIKTITINNVQGTGNWHNRDEKNNPGGDAIEIKWDVRRRR